MKGISMSINPDEFTGAINSITEKEPYHRLTKLTEEKDKLQEQIRELCNQEEEFDRAIMKAKYDIAILENAFTIAPWGISNASLSGQSSVTLYSDDKKHRRLSKLLQGNYHSSALLEEGIVVSFADWDISLNFDTTERAKEFIQRVGMKIDIKKVEEYALKAQIEANKARKILDEINALQGDGEKK